MSELIHEKTTSQIIAAAFEVANHLGVGFLEKVYENALKTEMEIRGFKVETQRQFVVRYKNSDIGVYIPDLMVDGKVIVEVKSTDRITTLHTAQLINYLKVTGIKVGLVINFGQSRVEFKRIIY